MFQSKILISFVAAALARASSVSIHNQCSQAVTIQVAQPGSATNVPVAAGATAGANEGIPQAGNGLAFSFVTDNAETNKAMSRAEVNFTPGDPAGNTFINLSNMYGYSVAVELTGTGCQDYVCNIGSGCPVAGPVGGSCLSPCCTDINSCQGASSCPVGSRGDVGGGPGPHADFYHGACPNSYAWGDEDSDEPTRNLASYCSGDDIQITLCTTKPSSNF